VMTVHPAAEQCHDIAMGATLMSMHPGTPASRECLRLNIGDLPRRWVW
jgi:hypothetical protein